MRWFTHDPIGYEGGTNLYQYVEGNPVGFVDPSGLVAKEIASDLTLDVINGLIGIGDGVTFNLTNELRSEDDPVNTNSLSYRIGELTGEVVGGLICGAGIARIAGALSATKYGRLLNQNRVLRVGPGKIKAKGGLIARTDAPRISIGPNRKNLSKIVQWLKHIDLRIRPFDK